VKRGHVKEKGVTFGLLIYKETMVTELKNIIPAKCRLKTAFLNFFNSLKHYKHFFPLCQNFPFVTCALFIPTLSNNG
jgi:hypothetical protein